MAAEPRQLHVVFFPFMGHGHMIPTLDIARLFSARGVKATIITTPFNAPTFTENIKKCGKLEATIGIEVFTFPSKEAGLPEGCENVEQALKESSPENFFKAGDMLKEQLEQYLEKTQPSCLVANMFFTWATVSAAKFKIPSLVFHGTSFFSLCAAEILRLYQPYKSVSCNEEPFILPSLPHVVKMTKLQISEDLRKDEETAYTERMRCLRESELKSYGVIVNSFYELEPAYADLFRKVLGRRAWNIGPVSLCNRTVDDKAQRGKQASIDRYACLEWLSSKQPNSVVYICFGSIANVLVPQMQEIAVALENSKQRFIWVIKDDYDGKENHLPPGFEQRIEGNGLIIRGWAPQVLILDHEAIGGFVTHCGWNSTLEAISAGVPMVTWPGFAEQFFNEILVTQILRIGVAVGAKKWSVKASAEDVVKHDSIERAVREIMEGDGAEERRKRAKELKEMARKAVKESGSSCSNISALIEELRCYHA